MIAQRLLDPWLNTFLVSWHSSLLNCCHKNKHTQEVSNELAGSHKRILRRFRQDGKPLDRSNKHDIMFRQADRNGDNIRFSEKPRERALYEGDRLTLCVKNKI